MPHPVRDPQLRPALIPPAPSDRPPLTANSSTMGSSVAQATPSVQTLRTDGDEVNLSGIVHDRANEKIHGVLGRRLTPLVIRLQRALILVPSPVDGLEQQQWELGARHDRHIGVAGQAKELKHHAGPQEHVAVNAGYPPRTRAPGSAR